MSSGNGTAAPDCDRCALIALYAEYNRAIDSGEATTWADTFTHDGVFEHPSANFVGRRELERFIRERTAKLGAHPCSHQRHWNDVLDVQLDGIRASGSCRLLVSGIRTDTNRPEVLATGRYTDELVKGENGWRFRRRRLKLD
jgi:hypothetical protein